MKSECDDLRHSGIMHFSTSATSVLHMDPSMGGIFTIRSRLLIPKPQVMLHGSQSPHSVTTQLLGAAGMTKHHKHIRKKSICPTNFHHRPKQVYCLWYMFSKIVLHWRRRDHILCDIFFSLSKKRLPTFLENTHINQIYYIIKTSQQNCWTNPQ